MKTKAAVVYETGKPIELVELDLEGPQSGEVLIRYTYAGLCHSDVHIAHGDLPARLPMVLGHEGAGIIEEVGPGVTRVKPGDHVVCSFIPNCGVCHYCATGRQSICDMGDTILEGYLPGDRFPLTGPRGQYGAMCMLGTFSQWGVIHQNSAVKVDDDLPLDKAVLVGCGVPTGWGSAVNTGEVHPGDTVIIQGIGGIGANAVQGAVHAGAANVIAVDPVAFKREKAQELGATHAVESIEEATEIAKGFTNGQGADVSIVTIGVTKPEHVGNAFASIRKQGTVIVTGLGDITEVGVPIPIGELTLFEKKLKGSLFGSSNPRADIPKMLDLYNHGHLKLDELVTKQYKLDEVAQGYEDMHAGKNIRGVLIFD